MMTPENLCKAISLLYRYSQMYFNKELRQYHLGSGQYIFLFELIENDGINQERLSELVKIDKTTTARAVAKLMREGYIMREADPSDRRSYLLHTTEYARQLIPRFKAILNQWNAQLLSNLNKEEASLLYRLLNQSMQNTLNGKK